MRLVIFIMSLLLFSLVFPTIGQANLNISANNAVLIEQSSGRILFEQKAHEKQNIASITKIMTAIIAIESGKMNEKAIASRRSIYTGGSSIYLEQGEKMTVEDLVYGLMLRSGNDAAVAISEHIGGSVEGFVSLMNEKARWIGMTNTYFDNPHGLDSDTHYSTAYDMALLMRYAMNNDWFQKITGTTTYKAENKAYAWHNKNKLLTSLYENCTGGKTGFTKKSGRTLTTAAKKDNMNLIAVTLNAPDDWRDHIQMYEWGFKNYQLKSIGKRGKTRYKLKDSNDHQIGFIHDDILFPLTESEALKLHDKSLLFDSKSNSGQDVIGKTTFYIDTTPILDVPIFANKSSSSNTSFILDIIENMKRITGINGLW